MITAYRTARAHLTPGRFMYPHEPSGLTLRGENLSVGQM